MPGKMNRLQFVACFVLFTVPLCLAGESSTSDGKIYHLRVVHNNDLHSRFEEMDENEASCPEEYVREKKCYGGFARIKKAADEARAEASKKGTPSIFLNAGDNFQDTPYYREFKSEIFKKVIDKLGFTAMSLGHHEFDDGLNHLVDYVKAIKTPVVCANLSVGESGRPDLFEKMKPSIEISIGEGDKKRNICIIGYLTTRAEREKTGKLKFSDEIETIRAEAQRLKQKEEKCNFIIVLGHGGIEKDEKIAREVAEINMVVGGDSHTFLYTPLKEGDRPPTKEKIAGPYPKIVTVKKKVGNVEKDVQVPVVQAYGYGKYLGVLDVDFDEDGNVIDTSGNPRLLDSSVEKDVEMEQIVADWTKKLLEKIPRLKEIVGHTRTFLTVPEFDEGHFESTLANLITDAFLDYAVQKAHENKEKTWSKYTISFYPTGGIRTTLDNKRSHGALTLEDFMRLMPFQNDMYEVTVRGSSLKQFLELSVKEYSKHSKTFKKTHYIHFSGLRVTFDLLKEEDHRVESVEALCRECEIPEYEPVDDEKDYHIITTKTEFNKFKYRIIGPEESEKRSKKIEGIKDVDLLLDYIKRRSVIWPILDNRVIIKNFALGVPESDEPQPMDESEPMDASGTSDPYHKSPFYMDSPMDPGSAGSKA